MDQNKKTSELDYYLKVLVKSSFFVFLAVIISKLASYGYKIVIAKSFGPDVYGIFSLVVIVISIIASIATIGLNEGIIRYISYYRGKNKFNNISKLITKSRNIFIFTSIIFTVLLILFAPLISNKVFHSKESTSILIGMGIAIPFVILSGLYLGVLRGFEKIKTYSSLINIFQNCSRLILILIFILMGFGIFAITLSYVITFVGLLFLAWFYSKIELGKIKIRKDNVEKNLMKNAMNYSWPLLFTGVLYNAFYWADSLLLGYFSTVEIVGFYSAAITIMSIFGIAPDLFMQMFFPLISFKFSQGKKELIAQITRQVAKWIYLLNILVFILIFLFPDFFLRILFGDEFIGAAVTLRLLSIGALFSSTLGMSTNLLSVMGKTKIVLGDFIVFTALNLILNIILIPDFGMIGAAVTTIITQFIFLITTFYQVRKSFGFSFLKVTNLKILAIALIIMTFVFYILRNKILSVTKIFLLFFVISLVYISLIYMFKLFDQEDREIIKSIARKTKLRN